MYKVRTIQDQARNERVWRWWTLISLRMKMMRLNPKPPLFKPKANMLILGYA